jgi:hypothetical protein
LFILLNQSNLLFDGYVSIKALFSRQGYSLPFVMASCKLQRMGTMKKVSFYALVAGISLLIGATTAVAHHSFEAEFDAKSTIEFTGTVKTIEWVNPHGFVQVDVANDDGTVATYRIIIGAPISLYRQGWNKDSVLPGTIVSFKGSRARNPNSRNVDGVVKGPDGQELWRGEGPRGSLLSE